MRRLIFVTSRSKAGKMLAADNVVKIRKMSVDFSRKEGQFSSRQEVIKVRSFVKGLKEKSSCNRPGVAQSVQRGLGSQIFMTFGTQRW